MVTSNWPTKKLGEICEKIESGEWGKSQEGNNYISCKVIRGTDFYSAQNGQFDIIPTRFVEKRKVEKLQLKPGDILVEISGGSLDQPTGRILFWEKETEKPIIFSNFVKKINVKINEVYPKYFYRYWQILYLKGRTKDYEERTTNIRNFKLKDFLENEKIPLPPLPIQQKIVKILDAIQEGVEAQEKIIEKTKELKKSLMADLFKYGAPSFRKGRKLKKTEIGEIPEDWEVVRLGDLNLFEIKLGGTPKTNIAEYWNGNINWITPNDLSKISSLYIKETERKITENGLKNGSNLLKEGSIIISTRAPIGYVAILSQPMAFNQGCKGIEIKDEERVNNIFLYYFLLKSSSKLNKLGAGSTFRELSTNDLKNFQIPLLSLPEQQEIAEILQTVDQKIEIEQKKKMLYEELFKAMLQKLMTAEIRVDNINLE